MLVVHTVEEARKVALDVLMQAADDRGVDMLRNLSCGALEFHLNASEPIREEAHYVWHIPEAIVTVMSENPCLVGVWMRPPSPLPLRGPRG